MNRIVERIQNPSNKDFSERYLNPGLPVLIENLVSSWPASGKWTPEYLASRCSKTIVPVVTMHDSNYAQGKHNHTQLGNYLRTIGAIGGSCTGDIGPFDTVGIDTNAIDNEDSKLTHYLAQVSIAKYFPELLDDIDLPSFFTDESPGSTVLYIGGTLFSQLHYHPFGSATLSVLSGKKRVRLFAPDQGCHLYPHSWYSKKAHLSTTHHKDPDPAEFPNFSQAEYMEITVLPGEMLFIPIYWWHSIENIGLSISVTSFWSRNWKSRFLPPIGPRGPYLYEPARRLISKGKATIRKVGRTTRIVRTG